MVLAGPRKGKGLGWGVEWEASTEGRGFAGHRRALVYSLALCEEFRHRRDLVELGAVGGGRQGSEKQGQVGGGSWVRRAGGRGPRGGHARKGRPVGAQCLLSTFKAFY